MRIVHRTVRPLRALVAVAGALLFVAGIAVPTLAAGGTSASSAAPAPTGRVYLVLGDSIAASMQPTDHGFDFHNGYAEQLFQIQQAEMPDLRLVKLGCPGERTSTIDRTRRLCPYPEGTQLDQAVAVLQSRDVALVTLHIGTNDAMQCFDFRHSAFDQACIDRVLPKIATRLTSIVQTLRAADSDVPIVGGNTYDPLLALWTIHGFPQDQVIANADVWTILNDTIEQAYANLGVPLADIETAFATQDFDTVVPVRGYGELPLSVARICGWAYVCSEKFDHDFHPTTFGYAVMTKTWEAAVDTALEPSP
jgi:lysophospholipase L1-like esterase